MKTRKVQSQARLLRESERRDRERMLTKLELENIRRYRNLADAIPHIVIKTHPNGTPEYFNHLWYIYTGQNPVSADENEWTTSFNVDDFEKLQALWKESMRNGADFEIEARLQRVSDSMQRWHLIRAVAEKGPIGETAAWILTCTDIHDRKETEDENVRLYHEAEEALKKLEERTRALEMSNHDLEQFAYVASHDLQEPLRKVMSYTNLLDEKLRVTLDGDCRRYMQYVLDGVNRMHGLIQGLLAYSRVETQRADFRPVELEEIVQGAIDTHHDVIDEKHAVVDHDEMPAIIAIETQLTQLFQNLIGNALKFQSEATPKIHIRYERTPKELIFSVTDNGIGIEPRYRDRIFMIFQRLHTQARYPGSGIGLAICKKIVERHGGRIWVESEPGKGSTFFFTLPLTRLAAPLTEPLPTPAQAT